MPIVFNGTTVTSVYFNGTEVLETKLAAPSLSGSYEIYSSSCWLYIHNPTNVQVYATIYNYYRNQYSYVYINPNSTYTYTTSGGPSSLNFYVNFSATGYKDNSNQCTIQGYYGGGGK